MWVTVYPAQHRSAAVVGPVAQGTPIATWSLMLQGLMPLMPLGCSRCLFIYVVDPCMVCTVQLVGPTPGLVHTGQSSISCPSLEKAVHIMVYSHELLSHDYTCSLTQERMYHTFCERFRTGLVT